MKKSEVKKLKKDICKAIDAEIKTHKRIKYAQILKLAFGTTEIIRQDEISQAVQKNCTKLWEAILETYKIRPEDLDTKACPSVVGDFVNSWLTAGYSHERERECYVLATAFTLIFLITVAKTKTKDIDTYTFNLATAKLSQYGYALGAEEYNVSHIYETLSLGWRLLENTPKEKSDAKKKEPTVKVTIQTLKEWQRFADEMSAHIDLLVPSRDS